MKKTMFVALLTGVALLSSCDKKENSYEFASIIYPGYSTAKVYADQSCDSLKFATTYNWSLQTSDEWITLPADSTSGTVPEGYYWVNKMNVYFTPNTTGKTRVGYVYFNADNKTVGCAYGQLHYLNIKHPAIDSDSKFLLTDTALQERDSLVFTTYAHNWTLTMDGAQENTWLTLATEIPAATRSGEHTIAYTLTPNKTGESRSATFKLTSAGVTTEITVKQEAEEVK